jgi:amidase
VNLWELTAVEQLRLLRSHRVSARELLAAHLQRIDDANSVVNAIVAMDVEVAAARAAAVDAARGRGEDPGPLGGLITAHKDLSDTKDFVTTYGSPIFAGHRPSTDASTVDRMRAAGVVPVGKTNTPEFGAGSHTFNPVYGTTRNPYDPELSAGGSSGGAAAALAAGMVAVADGSDTGGSLRNPAAWCNVVGFRPSPGVIPRLTQSNPWSTLSTDGPMARTVQDLMLLLRTLNVSDLRDPLCRTSVLEEAEPPDWLPPRVAWSRNLGGLPVERAVSDVLDRFRREVETLGWEVSDAEPDLTGADECFEVLRAWSFASGPAGRLGVRLVQVKQVVRDEVERGRMLTSGELAKAHATRAELWRRAVAFFERFDVLIAPATQLMPFPASLEYPVEVAGQTMTSYIEWMRAASRITVLGLPALSLPAGFSEGGLPVGAQLIGAPWGDARLLRVAAALEAATGHGTRRPGHHLGFRAAPPTSGDGMSQCGDGTPEKPCPS